MGKSFCFHKKRVVKVRVTWSIEDFNAGGRENTRSEFAHAFADASGLLVVQVVYLHIIWTQYDHSNSHILTTIISVHYNHVVLLHQSVPQDIIMETVQLRRKRPRLSGDPSSLEADGPA